MKYFFLLLLSIPSLAQTSFYRETATNITGQEAAVKVCVFNTNCTPVAIYADSDLTFPIASLVSDIHGRFQFFIANPGIYTIQLTPKGFSSQVYFIVASPITGVGGGEVFQTNGVANGNQSLFNAKAGANVTITDDGLGGITFAATGSGGDNAISSVPTTAQSIVQPWISPNPSTLCTDDLANVVYRCPDMSWSLAPTSPASLTTGSQTVTLSSCPKGLDATQLSTYVDIGTVGTEEQALITATTCSPGGGGSGTITFTAAHTHGAGYVVGSASVGAQEAMNYASYTATTFGSPHTKVVMNPTGANTQEITWKASVTVPGNEMTLDFTGTIVICSPVDGRACLVNTALNTQIFNSTFVPGLTSAPALITGTSITSNVATVTTATDPRTQGIGLGSFICVQRTDVQIYWGCGFPVTGVTASSVSYALTNADLGSVTSPGAVMLENAVIEDNGQGMKITNIRFLFPQSAGPLFNNGVLYFNDQGSYVDGAYGGASEFTCTAVWCAPLFFATGNASSNSSIGWFSHLNLSLGCQSNGVLWYSGNLLSVRDSVIQGQAQYIVRDQNLRGGINFADTRNVYTEVGACAIPGGNPDGNVGQQGLGVTGGNFGAHFGAQLDSVWQAYSPEFASSGATLYAYWIVVHNAAVGASYPLYIGWASDSGADTIPVSWPRVRGFNSAQTVDAVTYDLLRTTFTTVASPPTGTANVAVATAIAQCAGFVCTANDTNSGPTSYTVPAISLYPTLDHWPGSIVIGNNTNSGTMSESEVKVDYLWASSISTFAVVAVTPNTLPVVAADWCPASSLPFGLQAAGIVCLNSSILGGLGGRAVSGATTADTITPTDCGTVITHEQTASGAVTYTLPTPANLRNLSCALKICNNSPQIDTITPVTWTIQQSATATGTSASLTSGTCNLVKPDPGVASQWIANP